MISRKLPDKITVKLLGALLVFVAINALGGGYYGMSGAGSVPLEWLKGSPFHTYFIPGLVLFLCIGCATLLSSILVFKRHRFVRRASFLCGIFILLWLGVQVAIIGYVSWMQPATAVAAIIILFLTWQLKPNEH